MTTLTEIESAVEKLSPEQKRRLYRLIEGQLQNAADAVPHGRSVLDISPIQLGPILRPFPSADDLLDEMMETRE